MPSQLRPRLTPQELRFIAKALKHYEDLCMDKQTDARITLRELECEPYNLPMDLKTSRRERKGNNFWKRGDCNIRMNGTLHLS